jgi:hypothetical protein
VAQLQAGQRWNHVLIPGKDESSLFQKSRLALRPTPVAFSAMLKGPHYNDYSSKVVPGLRMSGAVPPIPVSHIGLQRYDFALALLRFNLINS